MSLQQDIQMQDIAATTRRPTSLNLSGAMDTLAKGMETQRVTKAKEMEVSNLKGVANEFAATELAMQEDATTQDNLLSSINEDSTPEEIAAIRKQVFQIKNTGIRQKQTRLNASLVKNLALFPHLATEIKAVYSGMTDMEEQSPAALEAAKIQQANVDLAMQIGVTVPVAEQLNREILAGELQQKRNATALANGTVSYNAQIAEENSQNWSKTWFANMMLVANQQGGFDEEDIENLKLKFETDNSAWIRTQRDAIMKDTTIVDKGKYLEKLNLDAQNYKAFFENGLTSKMNERAVAAIRSEGTLDIIKAFPKFGKFMALYGDNAYQHVDAFFAMRDRWNGGKAREELMSLREVDSNAARTLMLFDDPAAMVEIVAEYTTDAPINPKGDVPKVQADTADALALMFFANTPSKDAPAGRGTAEHFVQKVLDGTKWVSNNSVALNSIGKSMNEERDGQLLRTVTIQFQDAYEDVASDIVYTGGKVEVLTKPTLPVTAIGKKQASNGTWFSNTSNSKSVRRFIEAKSLVLDAIYHVYGGDMTRVQPYLDEVKATLVAGTTNVAQADVRSVEKEIAWYERRKFFIDNRVYGQIGWGRSEKELKEYAAETQDLIDNAKIKLGQLEKAGGYSSNYTSMPEKSNVNPQPILNEGTFGFKEEGNKSLNGLLPTSEATTESPVSSVDKAEFLADEPTPVDSTEPSHSAQTAKFLAAESNDRGSPTFIKQDHPSWSEATTPVVSKLDDKLVGIEPTTDEGDKVSSKDKAKLLAEESTDSATKKEESVASRFDFTAADKWIKDTVAELGMDKVLSSSSGTYSEPEVVDQAYDMLRYFETEGAKNNGWVRTSGPNSSAFGEVQVGSILTEFFSKDTFKKSAANTTSSMDFKSGDKWSKAAKLIDTSKYGFNEEDKALLMKLGEQRHLMLKYGGGDWKKYKKEGDTDSTVIDTFQGEPITFGDIKNKLEYGMEGLLTDTDKAQYRVTIKKIISNKLKESNGDVFKLAQKWHGKTFAYFNQKNKSFTGWTN